MIRKKQLLDRIEKLENKLKEQNVIIDFLIDNDKNDVIFESDSKFFMGSTCFVKYIYNGKLHDIYFAGKLTSMCSVVENGKDYAIIQYDGTHQKEFHLLDKEKETIIDITTIKNKYENQERVSENLKQSAEALGDALSSIFSAPKQNSKKCDKTEPKKCKKCDCEEKPKKKTAKKGSK